MASRIVAKIIFRIFVLRVSGKGDQEGIANQLDVLRGFEHVPGVAWLLANFDVRIMKASSSKGRQLRAEWARDHGLEVLHRKGREDFLGVSLVVDGTRFVIYASTAAQLDEENGTAFVRHLCRFISQPEFTGHADPEFTAKRDAETLDVADHPSLVNAFDATRFIRSLPRAMEVWEAAAHARAAFDVKDVRVDPEGGEAAQMIWTFLAFGSEMEVVVGKIRRFVGKLNLARAGFFPYREPAAPLGFTTTDDKRRLLQPRDDEQPAVAVLHALGMTATPFDEIATTLGTTHGVTSSDPKRAGIPLHQLDDPEAAARRLFLRRKLLAYRDHRLEMRFIGVLPNRLRPGSGHVLERRWQGLNAAGQHDQLGAISYHIPAPPPHVLDDKGVLRPGWLPGLSAEQEYEAWSRLIDKRAWDDPRDVGLAAEDDHEEPDIRSAALHRAPTARSGPAGHGTKPAMALSRLCLYRDDEAGENGPRTKLFPRRTGGRYELRREPAAPTKLGFRYKGSILLASWMDHELRGHLADLLLQIGERLESQGHTLGRLTVQAPTLAGQLGSDPHAQREREIAQLRCSAEQQRAAAQGYDKEIAYEQSSAHPDDERLTSLREQARQSRAAARDYDSRATALSDQPLAPTSRPPLEVGKLRDIIAGLKGQYARGLVPASFHQALRDLLPGGLRFEPGPNATTMYLVATAELPLDGGGHITTTDKILIPHAAGRGDSYLGRQRLADLTERYMRLGEPIEKVAADGRIADPAHMLRIIRETLTSGSRRVGNMLDRDEQRRRMPDPDRRVAAFSSPIPELRAVAWHRLTGTPGRPAGTSAAYARHIEQLYFAPPTAARADIDGRGLPTPWAWSSKTDHRLDQLTVLTSLPGPAKRMRANDLARCLGCSPAAGRRHVLEGSTDLDRNGHRYPATLRRVPTPSMPEGWYGKQASFVSEADKYVSPTLCPHADCAETYATAVVLAKEVLYFGTSVLCRRCRRPAVDTPEARKTTFPESVIAWADAQQHRTGSWVSCARTGCTRDFGAGPGRMWRWDDAGTAPTWHDDDCRLGKPAPDRYGQCAYADCTLDEGSGPGSLLVAGRGRRRWHSRDCEFAERRRKRAENRAARTTRCSWSSCTFDDGAGPGIINGAHHLQLVHDRPECRIGARSERQSPAA